MIEFENFVYLDVYRTGSKHTIRLLREISEEREVRSWRHSSISKGGPFATPRGKLVFTTVRNPWDWYVSLWSYGANKVEAIRRYLLEILPRTEVKRLYDTSNPEVAFREWLRIMHDPGLANRFMHENYPQSRLSPFMGLYTYRFLRVTTWYPYYFLRRWRIRNAAAIRSFHARRKAYGTALRSERLADDLVDFIGRNADRCRFKPNAADIIRGADPDRINASSRPLTDYRQYYDEPSRALVEARDSFFIEEFGYRF
ncbi:MAG: hypothetical protein ACJ8AS_03655 [Hyphomicrobiales bacterium]